MQLFIQISLPARLALLAIFGMVIGGQVNRGIYRLAWDQRRIGPWTAPPQDAPPRQWYDRIPIIGWIGLRREVPLHGPGYWIRPLCIELALGLGFAVLYMWELSGALLPRAPGVLVATEMATIHAAFLSHLVLISLMAVATFIDFDEQTIPDAITVPGTWLGLLLAVILPFSLPPVAHPVMFGPAGPMAFEVAPLLLVPLWKWPAWLCSATGLLCGLGCFTAWCLAILPRTCTLRRGLWKGIVYLVASTWRHIRHRGWWLVLVMMLAGWIAIAAVWRVDGLRWQTLLSSLVGLAFGGALVWGVRVMGSTALGVEAMGFGDVTLMAMIGAFLGWQPTVIIFFLAPFVAVFISLMQWLLTGEKHIAFGPYLCFGTLLLLVNWNWFWHEYAEEMFVVLGWWIPALMLICLLLLGVMLGVWRSIRDRLFDLN